MLPRLLLMYTLGATHFATVQPSHLVMDGTSNLGHWRCHSTALDARLSVTSSMDELNELAARIATATRLELPDAPPPEFRLRVPVRDIGCGNRIMEREMLRALRGEEHPVIEFSLREILGAIRYFEGGRYSSAVSGDLSVAGKTQKVSFQVDAWRLGPDSFYVRSSVPLRMQDFGVKPPSSFFGLIRARDEITVYFDLRLGVVPVRQD